MRVNLMASHVYFCISEGLARVKLHDWRQANEYFK
jgi:hypothetical protein